MRVGRTALAAVLLAAWAAAGAIARATEASPPSYASSDEQYAALRRKAGFPRPPSWAELPDWTGIWVRSGGPYRLAAPLNKAGEEIYSETRRRVAEGVEWDQLSDCLPAAYPRVLGEPFEREFIVRPETTWLHNVNGEETRRIYTDGRPHLPADAAYPLWEGDSIGFWSGQALVIHTRSVKGGAQGYFRSGPPYSPDLSAVEVWRKTDETHIEVEATFYDPEYLAGPWRVTYRYERVASGPRIENRADQWVCEENSNVSRRADGGTELLLPGDRGYRDPKTLLSPPEPITSGGRE